MRNGRIVLISPEKTQGVDESEGRHPSIDADDVRIGQFNSKPDISFDDE